ncbi:hypothetical protein PRIPAC_80200 [Pristionchus pacificus]|uniref:Uncharacterized protein n=1 Tax=Pristionchus pacificus TaxID=54126 RepID=H3DT20_PRIPA|nr:hypothetical protein PRIPAC_91060 [Pristionchus pacificus]KAF8373771.1 hypothetical protein PRIPAC_80200 [Pristionchus pacificus]|eukprot:PDM70377.1 hypothetical protein PRIPAC_46623 [Pristionchus pacificus]
MAAGDPIDRPFLRDVDQWMEQLYDCKQLSEQQVKMLFEQRYRHTVLIAVYEGENAVSSEVRNAVEKLAEYLKTSGY